MTDRRLTARLILCFGILLGIGAGVELVSRDPAQVGLAADVYATAAETVLADGDGGMYATAPSDHPEYQFLYPPVVVLVFLPHAVLGPAGALAIQTLVNLAAGLGIAVVLWRALRRRDQRVTRVDLALFAGVAVGSTHGIGHLINGQTTAWVALAVTVGFDALDRGRARRAGLAVAAGALVKVFPAAVGLWLLRARAWRALVAAIVAGLAGLCAGLVFGAEPTVTYLESVLLGRFEGQTFDGTPAPTASPGGAQRQVAGLLGVGSPTTALLAVGVLAPALAAVYSAADLTRDRDRQAAALATVVVTLLALPLQPRYGLLLVYPLVVLLYTLPSGTARTTVLVGAAVSFVRLDYEAVRAVAAGPGADRIVAASEAIQTVIQPPTIGLWLLLVGSLLVVSGQTEKAVEQNRADGARRR